MSGDGELHPDEAIEKSVPRDQPLKVDCRG
jgi:hypothetical protein